MFEEVAGYRLIRRLGEGGMGSVFLAEAPEGHSVAMKLIRPELLEREEFRARFRSEVARAQTVPPFCTAEVIAADPDHDPPYLVIEYVDGPSLFQVVRDQGPLQGAKLHTLAVGVATALTAIHGAGVVHRDLKPGNVLYSRGSIKVIDFGIARDVETQTNLTTANQVVGTIAYVSPERLGGAKVLTPAADVFAFGVLMAFAATGRTPFNGDTPADTAISILSDEPNLEGLTGSLKSIVEQALTKNPDDRPTARELLDQLLSSGPATPRTPVPEASKVEAEAKELTALELGSTMDVTPPKKNGRVRRGLVVTTALIAVLAVAIGGASAAGLLDGVIPFGANPTQTPSTVDAAATGTPGPSPSVLPSSSPTPLPSPSASPTPSAVPTMINGDYVPAGLRLMYRSPLTKAGNGWTPTGEPTKANCAFTAKGLQVTLEEGWPVWRCQGPYDSPEEFAAYVDVRTTDDACATIWFRFRTKGNEAQPDGGYALQVCNKNAYFVTHATGYETKLTMTLKKPVNEVKSRIGIVGRGNTYTFYQNGVQIGEWENDLYKSGSFRLGMLQRDGDPKAIRTVTFSNVAVYGRGTSASPAA